MVLPLGKTIRECSRGDERRPGAVAGSRGRILEGVRTGFTEPGRSTVEWRAGYRTRRRRAAR